MSITNLNTVTISNQTAANDVELRSERIVDQGELGSVKHRSESESVSKVCSSENVTAEKKVEINAETILKFTYFCQETDLDKLCESQAKQLFTRHANDFAREMAKIEKSRKNEYILNPDVKKIVMTYNKFAEFKFSDIVSFMDEPWFLDYVRTKNMSGVDMSALTKDIFDSKLAKAERYVVTKLLPLARKVKPYLERKIDNKISEFKQLVKIAKPYVKDLKRRKVDESKIVTYFKSEEFEHLKYKAKFMYDDKKLAAKCIPEKIQNAAKKKIKQIKTYWRNKKILDGMRREVSEKHEALENERGLENFKIAYPEKFALIIRES